MVRHTDICEQCVPQLRGWHPRGRDMYGAGLNGPQHTDVTHCEKCMDIPLRISRVTGVRGQMEAKSEKGAMTCKVKNFGKEERKKNI